MLTNVNRPSAVDVLRPFAVGDTFYADTTTTLAKLAIGTAGQVLQVNSVTIPGWTSSIAPPGLTANRIVSTNSVGVMVTPSFVSTDQSASLSGGVLGGQATAPSIASPIFAKQMSADTYGRGINIQRLATLDTWAFAINGSNALNFGYADNASGADAPADFTALFEFNAAGDLRIQVGDFYVISGDMNIGGALTATFSNSDFFKPWIASNPENGGQFYVVLGGSVSGSSAAYQNNAVLESYRSGSAQNLVLSAVDGSVVMATGGTRTTRVTVSATSLAAAVNIIGAAGFGEGVTSTATAAGTTTLTSTSTKIQSFTGVTTQTVQLPAANLFGTGIAVRYTINNQSTGIVTPTRAGADTFQGGGTTDPVLPGATQDYASDGVSVWLKT